MDHTYVCCRCGTTEQGVTKVHEYTRYCGEGSCAVCRVIDPILDALSLWSAEQAGDDRG